MLIGKPEHPALTDGAGHRQRNRTNTIGASGDGDTDLGTSSDELIELVEHGEAGGPVEQRAQRADPVDEHDDVGPRIANALAIAIAIAIATAIAAVPATFDFVAKVRDQPTQPLPL